MATVTFRGKSCHTSGEPPKVGTHAPDFRLTAADLQDVNLDTWRGRRKLLSIVPSLDTDLCAASTRRFEDAAPAFGSETAFIVVSADLPFAQSRFREDNGIEHVEMLSMMRDKEFARDYGVLVEDGPMAGLCARAVVVIDEENNVLHTELVADIGQEPDYDAALVALRG